MCDFSFGVKMSRWAVQGDLVAYHGLYTAPNPLGEHPLLCVDVWRVQGDRIVEHWDALHPTPQAEALLVGEGDGFANVPPDRVAANAAAARKRLELGDSEHRSDSTAKFTVRKTIASGDLVFVQLEAQTDSKAQAGFHIYRFTPEGEIAQRWEVLQDRVPQDQAANPHPHF